MPVYFSLFYSIVIFLHRSPDPMTSLIEVFLWLQRIDSKGEQKKPAENSVNKSTLSSQHDQHEYVTEKDHE